MFKVDDLFKDVYERPPGHEVSGRPKRMEKKVLASVIRQTDFHNKLVEQEEMWASRDKDLNLQKRVRRERRGKRQRQDSASGNDQDEKKARRKRSEKMSRRPKKKEIFIRKKPKAKAGGGSVGGGKIDWEAERRKNEKLREEAYRRRREAGLEDERIQKVNLEDEDEKDDVDKSTSKRQGNPTINTKSSHSQTPDSPLHRAKKRSKKKHKKDVRKDSKRDTKKDKKKKKKKDKKKRKKTKDSGRRKEVVRKYIVC
ncbi:hypothetical protein AAMO2058_001351600 [Amorphochlora amoebiformis]